MNDSQMKLLVSLMYLGDSEMGTGTFALILISQKCDSVPAGEPLRYWGGGGFYVEPMIKD